MDGFFPRELATGGSSLLKGAWLTGYDVEPNQLRVCCV